MFDFWSNFIATVHKMYTHFYIVVRISFFYHYIFSFLFFCIQARHSKMDYHDRYYLLRVCAWVRTCLEGKHRKTIKRIKDCNKQRLPEYCHVPISITSYNCSQVGPFSRDGTLKRDIELVRIRLGTTEAVLFEWGKSWIESKRKEIEYKKKKRIHWKLWYNREQSDISKGNIFTLHWNVQYQLSCDGVSENIITDAFRSRIVFVCTGC